MTSPWDFPASRPIRRCWRPSSWPRTRQDLRRSPRRSPKGSTPASPSSRPTPARRWPAIDPDRTSARAYPDSRHEHIACAARDAIADYAVIDPVFALPDPSRFDDPAAAQPAQALVRYLTHSFRPFELFSALPAADTPMAEVLDIVEALLGL